MPKAMSSEEKKQLENLISNFERKISMKIAECEGRLAQLED